MSMIGLLAMFFGGLAPLVFFIGLFMILFRRWRRRGGRLMLGSVVVTVIAITAHGFVSEREAADAGFESADEMRLAKEAGIVTSAEWEKRGAAVKAATALATEKEAAEKAVADEKARLAEQQAIAEKARAAEAEELACRKDLSCWGEKHSINASVACQPLIERLAKYDFEWTDAWMEPKFGKFRWGPGDNSHIAYLGDRIKFQNGFGAWQYHRYSCVYDPDADAVIDVTAAPGRY